MKLPVIGDVLPEPWIAWMVTPPATTFTVTVHGAVCGVMSLFVQVIVTE